MGAPRTQHSDEKVRSTVQCGREGRRTCSPTLIWRRGESTRSPAQALQAGASPRPRRHPSRATRGAFAAAVARRRLRRGTPSAGSRFRASYLRCSARNASTCAFVLPGCSANCRSFCFAISQPSPQADCLMVRTWILCKTVEPGLSTLAVISNLALVSLVMEIVTEENGTSLMSLLFLTHCFCFGGVFSGFLGEAVLLPLVVAEVSSCFLGVEV